MGLFVGGVIVVIGFIALMSVAWCLGVFKGIDDTSEDIYNKKTVEKVALLIYQSQVAADEANRLIDTIPTNWLVRLIPQLGSRYHIRRKAIKIGCKL